MSGTTTRSTAGSRRQTRARWGEALAALCLRLKGYRIEARNWRCSLGELDLVCLDGEVLVFVEVKARTSRRAGRPEEAVDSRKRARLVRLAQAYLNTRQAGDVPCRFDVVAVELGGMLPAVTHLKAAFRADGL